MLKLQMGYLNLQLILLESFEIWIISKYLSIISKSLTYKFINNMVTILISIQRKSDSTIHF